MKWLQLYTGNVIRDEQGRTIANFHTGNLDFPGISYEESLQYAYRMLVCYREMEGIKDPFSFMKQAREFEENLNKGFLHSLKYIIKRWWKE